MSVIDSPRVTAPLREEHRHLLPHVEELARAGDAIGVVPAPELRATLDGVLAFLAGHLIPHAAAEDAVLYPEIDRLLGERDGTRATDTMRRDHVEIARLTERLALLAGRYEQDVPTPPAERELRRLLYGLDALVTLHFAKEEEVYLPLLDRELTADEALELFERMEGLTRD
jgi:iron-sulfur cluster repair protein YtfE (RIC family)